MGDRLQRIGRGEGHQVSAVPHGFLSDGLRSMPAMPSSVCKQKIIRVFFQKRAIELQAAVSLLREVLHHLFRLLGEELAKHELVMIHEDGHHLQFLRRSRPLYTPREVSGVPCLVHPPSPIEVDKEHFAA